MTRRTRWTVSAAGAVVVIAAVAVVWAVTRSSPGPEPARVALPLRAVGEVGLPGDNSRFDYAGFDADRGLLFVAHLGASEIVEIDVRAHRVVRTIPNVAQVHGVIVVPALHRVFATATADNRMVGVDEDTGAVVVQAPTGESPDGLAFDPKRGAVWTTNESGGSETVIDATTGSVRGTVSLGGDVGNVVYDPSADRMMVAVQGRNDLAVIDPGTFAITQRIPLPGCDFDHGLSVDPAGRLAFAACVGNTVVLTVDLTSGQVTGSNPVGQHPDVLAYDHGAHRLYVAAESGTVTVLDVRDRRLVIAGSDHLADGAHVVAVDPGTHHSFYPVPAGANGHPALLEQEPVR